jgi:hypothetical protein
MFWTRWTCLSKAFGAGVIDGAVAAVASEIKVMAEAKYTSGDSLAPPYLADANDGKENIFLSML